MNDYGRGGVVLGTATVLPATGAIALWTAHRTNNIIIFALLALSCINLIMSFAMVIRYLVNDKK